MLGELVVLAVGNLNRARARLVMTAGGVLVGTTAVILLVALTTGLQRAAEASIGNSTQLTELEVYPNYGFAPNGQTPENIPTLTVKAVNEFWKIPGVAAVIPVTNLQAGEISAGKYSGYTSILGYGHNLAEESAIILWNAVSNAIFDVARHQRVGDRERSDSSSAGK